MVACDGDKDTDDSKKPSDDTSDISTDNTPNADNKNDDNVDDDENNNDEENDNNNNDENNNDENNDDENNDDENNTPAGNGSGSITKPSGGSQIPTPGVGNLEEEGDPAINELDVANYDLAKYMYPIWKTDISYAENVFVCEYTANSNLEFQLLYPITEIVSVRSANLQTLYKEGVDYEITSNGNLKVLKGGKIPLLTHDKYYFPYTNETTNPNAFPERSNDGPNGTGRSGYGFFYDEVGGTTDPGMSKYSIAVTYRHTAASTINTPASKTAKFTNVINKIKAGQDIKIVALGDSITDGWSSSSQVNMLPGCPNYHNMVTEYIKATYNVNVTNVNLAYSGKSTPWALNMCSDRGYIPIDKVCAENPDLVVLAFGMNDGCSYDSTTFLGNINTMLNKIKTNCPNACVVVVGTQLPNPEVTWKVTATNSNPGPILKYHIDYETALKNAESSWTNAAFANTTRTHMEMIKNTRYNLTGRKTYEDTAGSNSNHPNDYFHRVYAQVIIQTIFGEFALYD